MTILLGQKWLSLKGYKLRHNLQLYNITLHQMRCHPWRSPAALYCTPLRVPWELLHGTSNYKYTVKFEVFNWLYCKQAQITQLIYIYIIIQLQLRNEYYVLAIMSIEQETDFHGSGKLFLIYIYFLSGDTYIFKSIKINSILHGIV